MFKTVLRCVDGIVVSRPGVFYVCVNDKMYWILWGLPTADIKVHFLSLKVLLCSGMCFWWRWASVALRGRSLVQAGRGHALLAVCRLLIAAAVVAEHRL